ncbi:hypothetical protein ACGF13_35030 [Kitasatospora sp. NPDC048286]|uniref:hypothetical protein n=1 Tax=Kitasatospora sp. NPDC048286 TaxID=3364047 RepID=UPI00371392A1
MPLTRLNMVDVSAVIDLAGPDVHVFPVAGALVALGSAAMVIIADPFPDPADGGVWNDQEFRLIGPVPAPVYSRLVKPLPFTAVSDQTGLPLHLAVRLDDACLYLGVVQVGMCEYTSDELIRCRLRIAPPLSREVLTKVRPPAVPPALPGIGWLDHVKTDPGLALELFVTGWHPVTERQPPFTEIPKSLPLALARFYRLAGERPAIRGGQNRIRSVTRLSTDNRGERLFFADENHGGWDWSIPWELDGEDTDPIVWLTEDTQPVPEQEPLSGFLLQFSLYEAAMTAPYKAFPRNFPTQLIPKLEACLRRVPLRPFLAPIVPTDFLVGPGVVAHISPDWHNEDEVDVWIGACHRSALGPLGDLHIPWSRFDG